MLSLKGRTALVTGASSGIGRAIALAYAQAGACVVINHLGHAADADAVVAEIETAGGKAFACEADVSRAADVERLLQQATQALGPVHILVNNAGIIQEKPFLQTSEADWDRMLGTDLKSVFLLCRAVLPAMVEAGSGVVINIASELGILGRAQFAPYCAAKAGVIGLTRSLAREFAPHIRINAIAPGPINTAMLDAEHMSPEWRAKEMDIPMQRFGEPEEIAATALFLASDMARFYCGQVLGPNGGALMG
ncbi:short-chain dehydrogenase [Rhodoferax lacus]|uniref:Short-chain dehydrogenase n=1 Tax=Rhodoferax lacus TaxID=2184758 RepID=A0A3E1RFW1_9BURK|nr:3-oxoacyl-ACP reductase family protein [Rhodoferax lacus]RFO97500.1 short-chain dehydrogenase [Rhodoferax lacus]